MPARPRRLLFPSLAVAAGLLLATGCGSSDGSDGGVRSDGASQSTTSVVGDIAAPSIPVTPEGAADCRTPEEAQAETEAPEPAVPQEPETSITVTDDIAGCGDVVEASSTVTVQYVLISQSSGEVVDSSWEGGQPFDATLGQGRLISGWDIAIPGMRAGGRRTLVLGPTFGYGEQGSPPAIPPGDTLVFVVDALAVG